MEGQLSSVVVMPESERIKQTKSMRKNNDANTNESGALYLVTSMKSQGYGRGIPGAYPWSWADEGQLGVGIR